MGRSSRSRPMRGSRWRGTSPNRGARADVAGALGRRPWVLRPCWPPLRWWSLVAPLPADTELECRGGQDDEEQGDGNRGGVADVVVLEGPFSEVHDDASGGIAWPTVCQDDHGLVDLEGPDHR